MLVPGLPSRKKNIWWRWKIEQNQPLNFALSTYISRLPKLVSKCFVNDCRSDDQGKLKLWKGKEKLKGKRQKTYTVRGYLLILLNGNIHRCFQNNS